MTEKSLNPSSELSELSKMSKTFPKEPKHKIIEELMENEYGKFNERGVYRTPEDLKIIHKKKHQILSLHLRTLLVVTVLSAFLALINLITGRKPFIYNICLSIMAFGLTYGTLNVISTLSQYRIDPEDHKSIMHWNIFDSLQRNISALISSIVYMFLQELEDDIYLRRWGRTFVIGMIFLTLEKGLVVYIKIRHHEVYFKERIDENLKAMATVNRIRLAFPSSKDHISMHSILSSDSLSQQLRTNKRISSARKISHMKSPLQLETSDVPGEELPEDKTEAKTNLITDDNIINTVTDSVSWIVNGSAKILHQVISGKALIDDDYDDIKASFESDIDSNDILEVSGNSAIHEICSNIFYGLLNSSNAAVSHTSTNRDTLVKEDFFSVLKPDDANNFFEELDYDDNGDITLEEMKSGIQQIYHSCAILSESLSSNWDLNKRLDSLLMFVVFIFTGIMSIPIFEMNMINFIVAIGSSFVTIKFFIQGSLKSILNTIIFIFVQHPFDVGDQVDIKGIRYCVKRIGWSTTTFSDKQAHLTYISNCTLVDEKIINYRRSGPQSQIVCFKIAGDTSNGKLKCLQEALKIFLSKHPRDFADTCIVTINRMIDRDRLEIRYLIKHKSNFQFYSLYRKRCNMILNESILIMNDLGIKLAKSDISICGSERALEKRRKEEEEGEGE